MPFQERRSERQGLRIEYSKHAEVIKALLLSVKEIEALIAEGRTFLQETNAAAEFKKNMDEHGQQEDYSNVSSDHTDYEAEIRKLENDLKNLEQIKHNLEAEIRVIQDDEAKVTEILLKNTRPKPGLEQ